MFDDHRATADTRFLDNVVGMTASPRVAAGATLTSEPVRVREVAQPARDHGDSEPPRHFGLGGEGGGEGEGQHRYLVTRHEARHFSLANDIDEWSSPKRHVSYHQSADEALHMLGHMQRAGAAAPHEVMYVPRTDTTRTWGDPEGQSPQRRDWGKKYQAHLDRWFNKGSAAYNPHPDVAPASADMSREELQQHWKDYHSQTPMPKLKPGREQSQHEDWHVTPGSPAIEESFDHEKNRANGYMNHGIAEVHFCPAWRLYQKDAAGCEYAGGGHIHGPSMKDIFGEDDARDRYMDEGHGPGHLSSRQAAAELLGHFEAANQEGGEQPVIPASRLPGIRLDYTDRGGGQQFLDHLLTPGTVGNPDAPAFEHRPVRGWDDDYQPKLHRQIDEKRQRNIQRDLDQDDANTKQEGGGWNAVHLRPGATPEEAGRAADHIRRLLDSGDAEEREVEHGLPERMRGAGNAVGTYTNRHMPDTEGFLRDRWHLSTFPYAEPVPQGVARPSKSWVRKTWQAKIGPLACEHGDCPPWAHLKPREAVARPGRGEKTCGCCKGNGSHGDGTECAVCDGNGATGKDVPAERCPGQPQPRRRHWREKTAMSEDEQNEIPAAERTENVAHMLASYRPYDFDTWPEVEDNFHWDHPVMRAFVDHIRRNGVQRPIPVDYEQNPPQVRNGHTRLLSARRAGITKVPTRQYIHYADPDDDDSGRLLEGHEAALKDPAQPADETSSDQKDLLGHFEAAGHIDLYHHTYPESADAIRRERRFLSDDEEDRVYFTNAPGSDSAKDFADEDGNYGVVHVRMPRHLVNEWPGGVNSSGEAYYDAARTDIRPEHILDDDPLRKTAAGVDDYGMRHRPLRDGAPAHDLTEGYQEDIYTHPRYWAAEWPEKGAAEGLKQLRDARGNPEHPVTIYRASPSGAPYRMHTGDWVSLSPSYAAQHAYNEGDDEWHVHKAVVPAKHVRDAGTDQYREQGYWGPDIDTEHHSGPRPVTASAHQGPSPEEYGMNHRPSADGPPLHDMLDGDMMPRDFYDRMHEYNLYSHDNGLLGEAAYQAQRKIRLFRGKPEKLVTIWRSAPAVNPESRNAKRGEINHGDWVGLSRHKALAESYETNDPRRGSLHANDPKRYHIWSARVPASHVRNADGDMTEWGYFGPDVKDIPHISEQCSHRARVKQKEAAVQHQGAGETAPEGHQIWAEPHPDQVSPVAAEVHHNMMTRELDPEDRHGSAWYHGVSYHGPYHVIRHPQTRQVWVVDRHGRDASPTGGHYGNPERDGNWGEHQAWQHQHGLESAGPEAHRFGTPDEPRLNLMNERVPEFPHSRVDPQDEERVRRPEPRVHAPEGYSPDDEYHGSYEVVRHPETGKYHVIDNQGRKAHVLPLDGHATQLQAERSRDWTEHRQQSKERARGIADSIWEGGHEVLDPGGTPESRQSEENIRSGEELMTRYHGGKGQVKFDDDEEGGAPYYEREHHLPGGQPSGWYVKHKGSAPRADVYHRATGDEAHDTMWMAENEHGNLPDTYGEHDLEQDLKEWHDQPDGMRRHLEEEPWQRGGNERIQRWKQQRTGSRHEVVAHFDEPPDPPQGRREAAVNQPAEPEYGPKPEYRAAPEGASDDEQMAHWDRQREIKHAWESKINRGISLGDITPGHAKSLGHYFDGHQTDRYGDPTWQPLPQHLYHVTTDLPGVRAHGLKTREELAQLRGGHGLGGGPDDMISLTGSHDTARGILHAVHEFHRVVNGQYTPAQMWADAKAGKGAPRPFHEDLASYHRPGWKEGDPHPRGLDSALRGVETKAGGLLYSPDEMNERHGPGWRPHASESDEFTGGDGVKRYNVWERDLDPDGKREHAADFYKNFAAYREHAGGPENPLFFSTDTKAFAAKDPAHFGIVHARPKPGAMGHPASALGEWRTGTGDAVQVHRAERLEGGHLREAALVTLGATDWDQFHDNIPAEIHRGLYAPESHPVFAVQASDEDIARGLIAAHQEEQFPSDRNRHELFGTHWSASEDVARDFAREHERTHHDESEDDHDEHSEATPVVFHARRPARHEIEDDPRRLGWQNVEDHDHPEREVPIRHGAPVRIVGVSWLKHTGLGPMWHRHDLREPVELRAEDRDSPDDPAEWNGEPSGHLKEASMQHFAALENPHTGGTDWYHGSPYQFGAGEFSAESASPLQHESDEEDAGHWNALLGGHFAASHRMAEEFSKGEHGNSDGHGEEGPAQNVLHARLELENPKVYGSEHDMDQEAYEHEWKAGNHHELHHDPELHAEAKEEGWEDELPRTYRYAGHGDRMRAQSEGDPEYAAMGHYHPYATGWLNAHPDKWNIAQRHRQRLTDAGHDGIVYGNEFEKHHGTAGQHHVCAIPFYSEQVDVTQRHTGEHCVDPHSAARQWPGRSQPMLPGFEHEGSIEVVAHFTEPRAASLKGTDPSGIRRHLAEAHGYTPEDIDSIRWHGKPNGEVSGMIADNLRMSHEGDHLRRGDWENRESEEHAAHPRHPDGPPANPEQDLYSFRHPGSDLDLDRERAKAHAEERARPHLPVPAMEHEREEAAPPAGHGSLADIGQSMLGFDKDMSEEDRQYFQDAIDHSRRRAPASEPINAGDAKTIARSMRAGDHLRDNGWTVHDTGRYPRGVSVSVGEHHRATLSPNTPSGWHVRTHPADYGSAVGHIRHDIDVPDEELSSALSKYYASPQIKSQVAAQRAEVIAEEASEGHTAALATGVVAHFMDGEDHDPVPEWPGGKLFHGTRSILHPGEMISADEAVRHKAHPSEVSEGYVHATPKGGEAQYWAEHADPYTTHSRMTELGRGRTFSYDRGENQGHAYPPRVYEVEPTGHVEPDPNGEGASYRSESPLRVLRQVRPLSCYAEEHENEEHWPDHPHYEHLLREQEEDGEDDGRHEAALTPGPDQLSPAEDRGDRWHAYKNASNDHLHRGIFVQLPEDLHSYVHDESVPREQRAAALQQHFADSGDGLGMHWTPHPQIAQRAIWNAAAAGHGLSGGRLYRGEPEEKMTEVMLHVRQPGERNRLPARAQDEHDIGWKYSRDEDEFPLRPGSPLRLAGISWKQHEPQYPNEPFEHHDFAKPMRHVSSAVAPLAAIEITAHSADEHSWSSAPHEPEPRSEEELRRHMQGHGWWAPSWSVTDLLDVHHQIHGADNDAGHQHDLPGDQHDPVFGSVVRVTALPEVVGHFGEDDDDDEPEEESYRRVAPETDEHGFEWPMREGMESGVRERIPDEPPRCQECARSAHSAYEWHWPEDGHHPDVQARMDRDREREDRWDRGEYDRTRFCGASCEQAHHEDQKHGVSTGHTFALGEPEWADNPSAMERDFWQRGHHGDAYGEPAERRPSGYEVRDPSAAHRCHYCRSILPQYRKQASVTAAHDRATDEGPFTWGEIAQRHPRVYGDDEDHEPGMGEGGGHDIADAAAELYHDRPSHPYAESTGELHPDDSDEMEFHPRTVDVNRIDYMRVDPGERDPRVERAKRGFQDHRQREKIPPLILVHRHGVYQVADGSHRANGAAQAHWPSVRAYVAYSPHENEPFAGSDGDPPARGPFHGAEKEDREPWPDQNGVRRRISFPGFPHTAEVPRPDMPKQARKVSYIPVYDRAVLPSVPGSIFASLGNLDADGARELAARFGSLITAIREGLLRVAQHAEESLPLDPSVPELIRDMAASCALVERDVMRPAAAPEAAWEEPGRPNR